MDPDQLRLDADEMRRLGYAMVDRIVEHVETLPRQPVTHAADRAALRAALGGAAPQGPVAIDETLRLLDEHVLANIMHVDHPRFFAYIPGPGNFVSAMADALAAGLNIFSGTWLAAAGPTQVEETVVDWMRQWCGLPASAGGLLVSGGSMANVTALHAARVADATNALPIEHAAEKARGASAAHAGAVAGAPPSSDASAFDGHDPAAVVYYSDQTHASVERGLRLLGFSKARCRELPSDDAFRLDPTSLSRAVADDRAAGLRPFCVIANAGTTNTAAVDPLDELADLCERERMWLHVDGAYGAAAVLVEEGRAALRGIARANSIALDPHKWLFQPFECGCVLLRDRRLLSQAFRITPHYLQDAHRTEPQTNPCDLGVQLTRGARALKLWMSIRTFGLDAFRAAIRRGLEMARLTEAELLSAGCWEIVTPANLGMVSFRYAPPGMDAREADAITDRLVAAAYADGYAMISSTRLRGRTALRMCPINPRTTEADIRTTVARLAELAGHANPPRQ